jgi:hypothetical protein
MITEIIDNVEIIDDTIDKGVKMKKNEKDLYKRRSIEEEDIITEKKKTVIRKIKEKRPSIGEETIPYETTYEFNVEKYPAIVPTILKTPKTINEANAQQEVVELSTDNKYTCDKAQINIISRSAAESIVTQVEEKEENRKEKLNIKTSTANAVLEVSEGFTTDYPDTQSPLEDIAKSFDIVPSVAKKDIIPQESITISEIYPDQTLDERIEHIQQNKEAKVTVISHSQKVVTELIASVKEGDIKHELIPQKKKAIQDFVEHESVNVVEVNEAYTEGQLENDIKPTPVKSSIDYSLNEQLIVSELHSEIQPEKYYPEIIVPTEVAEKLIVPSNSAIMTYEVETSEKEAKYNPSQLPLGFKVDISMIPEKCIQVSEENIQDKEAKLLEDRKPEKTFAVSEIIEQSGLIVNSVNQHESEETFISHLPESQTAILKLNTANKVCTSSIIEMNEAESNLNIPVIPEMKQIKSSVLGLEVPDVTEVIANETESSFTLESTPEILPDTSFTESYSYIVTETRTGDHSNDFDTTLKYDVRKATSNFEEMEAKQISQANVQESNVPFYESSKPTSILPETSFAPIQSITVEQTVVAEQEQALILKANPEFHKSKFVPTHTLQAVTIEQITPENRVDNISDTFKDCQPTKKVANVNFVDDQSIIVKEISTFESECDLMIDDKPKNVHAKPKYSGHDVAETTEVTSSDTVEQLNVERIVNDKAKIEHVPYETAVSEVTSVNEFEDVLLDNENKQLKTVNIVIDEVIGVNIIEQPIYEKETEAIEKAAPKTKNATTEFVPFEIADHSEVITGDYTSDLLQPEVTKVYAHLKPSTHESVILYETDISEKEKEFSGNKIPLTFSANTSMVMEEAIEVTEILSNDRPESISVSITPKEETAQANVIPFKSIERHDIIPSENVENVKDQSKIIALAHVSQNPLHGLETSLIVSAESENLLTDFVLPDSKKAETKYVELDVPISVVEILTQDKETEFKPEELLTRKLDKQEIVFDEGHITSETVVCSTTTDFNQLIPQSVYALTSENPQIAIESQETAPLEKEGIFLNDDITQKRCAKMLYEEVKGIQISEQVQLETKEEIIMKSKPIERKGNVTITAQDIAETSETKVESPIEELKIEFPKEQLANMVQDKEVRSFEVSEIIPQETESTLVDNQQYDSKIINVSIEDNIRSCVITEILPKEKEGQFSEQLKPIQHHAEEEILSYEGLLVNETNASICEEKLNNFEYSTKVGNQVVEPLESIQISEVNVQELEDSLKESMQPQIKHATPSVNENVGLIIKSTVINDKENILTIDELKAENATKVSNLIDYKVPENFEKITLECVQPIKYDQKQMHKASTEHVLLKGISTTIVNTQESEIKLEPLEKASKKIASQEFEMVSTVDTTEVFLVESESDLNLTSLPRSQIAVSDLSETQQVASHFEVLPQNATHDLRVQTLPSVINLIPKPTETHSLEVTETVCHETEKPMKSEKNTTSVCNYTIQSDQNIEVTEIITNESEKIFEVCVKNKSSEANVVFDQNQTLTIEEIQTSDDITPLIEDSIKPINASKQLEPLLGVFVTEIKAEESETPQETQLKPAPKYVTQILPEKQSLNVTSTIVVEKESKLNKFKPNVTENALISSVYSPKFVVESQENFVQMSTSDLKTIKPNEIFLESSQIPYDSISQIEINLFEKESTLDTSVRGEKKVANINVDTINILDTTEIITGNKESVYIPSEKPNTKHALVNITDSQPVSNIFEVKTEDSSSELQIPTVVRCSAIPGQEVVHGVTITDNATQDKEEIFEGKFKPEFLVAKVNIENEKEIKTITEIILQEMEGQIKTLDLPSAKNAQIEITSGQKIAEKTEIISNTALGSIENIVTESSTAVPIQETCESIQSTITVPEDKEMTFDSNLIQEKSNVNVNFEESESINITEIIVDDKEGKYVVSNIPKLQTAGKNILPNEATEITLVLADTHLTEFNKLLPKEELATVKHETHTNVAQTETTVHDCEKYLKPTKIVSNKAELKMIPNKSLIITEVITDDNDEQFIAKEDQTSQQAITSLTTLREVPQVSEIISSISTGNVINPTVSTDNVSVLQSDVYDTAISTEINAFEKEEHFTQKPKTDLYTAEVKFKEDKPLNVSETVSNEIEQPLEINKPIKKSAVLTQSTFDVVTISENSSIEKEQSFNSIKIPEGQMVNVAFESNLNVEVSEVNVIDKENELLTPILKSDTATILDISTQPVVNISEVITSMNVKDFPQCKQPEHAFAKEAHLSCQSLLQTEADILESEGVLEKIKTSKENASIITDTFENIVSTEQVVSEKEGILKELEKPNLKHAQCSLEEIKSSVIVSNIISEDKEIELIVKSQKNTSNAKVISENLEVVTTTEQNISEKESDLTMDIPRNENAIVTFENTQLGIFVSDVIPGDKEDNFSIQNKTYSAATVTTENYESLTTNEQILSEKENDMEPIPKIDTVTANVSFEKLMEGASILEITSNEKENIFQKTRTTKPLLANMSTEDFKPIMISENQMLCNVDELNLPQREKETAAKIVLDKLNHLTIEETMFNENELSIDTKCPNKLKIEPIFSELISLESSEIFSETKPTEIKKLKPIEHKAKKGKPIKYKSIEVNEDMVLETASELNKDTPDTQRASIKDITISTGKITNLRQLNNQRQIR